MTQAENEATPRVESDYLYTGAEAFAVEVESSAWWQWLIDATTFYYSSTSGTFTARKEAWSDSWYWYAYPKHPSKLDKCYIGNSRELTKQRLVDVACQLAEKARS